MNVIDADARHDPQSDPEPSKCACCGEPYRFRWCDHHGIAVCTTCGLPYRLLHYDAEDRREEKPPSVAVEGKNLDAALRYWQEMRRRVLPGMYDFPARPATYSGATPDDVKAWNAWWDRTNEDDK